MVFGAGFYWFARYTIHHNIIREIVISLVALYYRYDGFFVYGVESDEMRYDGVDALFKCAHLLFVAQHPNDIIPSHNPQFRKQRPDHQQVLVAGSIEHYGVYVFNHYMLFYHCHV